MAAEAGTRYFNPAGILTALNGIGLVLVSDLYDWSDTFVSIGLGIVIATGLIGALVHRPGGGERMIAALEAGDQSAAAVDGKRDAIWGAVTAVLLIVAVVVMVLKTGAVGSPNT